MSSDEEDYSDSDSEMDGLEPSVAVSSSNPLDSTTVSARPDPRSSKLALPKCLPYEVESLDEMDKRIRLIARRILDCVEAKEWDVGFPLWSRRLQNHLTLKYPLPKPLRIKLANLYYELATLPGLDATPMGVAANMVMALLRPKKLISIADLRLDWRGLYGMLVKELFPKRRKANHTNISTFLLDMAEVTQRFRHPSEVDAMLAKFLPRFHGDDIDSILATQAFMLHFLPYSHPQRWLPVMFKIWEGINSGLFDEQMLDLLARLTVLHVNPRVSDPKRLETIPRTTFNEVKRANGSGSEINGNDGDMNMNGIESIGAGAEAEVEADEDGLPINGSTTDLSTGSGLGSEPAWPGLRKDIGLLTEREFQMVMTKCLRTMGTPVGGPLASAAAASKTPVDAGASKTILNMSKPTSKLHSLSMIIVYSMAEDGPASSGSAMPTSGIVTPVPSAISRVKGSSGMKSSPSTDSLARAGQTAEASKTYLGGSKALEHLHRLITSCETFFHPSNHGSWTLILTTFVQDLAWEFARRWKEEEKAECKTPTEWRLTPTIKREFVLLLRTVSMMSMFSKDASSQAATKSALKSMSLLEPDLIVIPVIEKAIPALQGLEETARTTAVLKALGGVSYAMAARHLCPSGSQYLGNILELCLPGIDMNDPGKSISTMIFLMSVLRYVRLEELEVAEEEIIPGDRLALAEPDGSWTFSPESELQPYDEDTFRSSTSLFATWMPDFLGRIFALYDNLPEESEAKESRTVRSVSTEEQIISTAHATLDAVMTNLSPAAVDRVIKQVFDYVSTTVRANSVRVMNGLISAMGTAAPKATLDKFWDHCCARVKAELDSGASSTRNTTTSSPVAADAALHWHFALLYGCLSNSGSLLVTRADSLIPFLNDLVNRTYTEAGYSWSGRLLERIITNLATTYTTENHLVNADEWESTDFKVNHHCYWGKQYKLADVKLDWHVPSEAEVDVVFRIIDEVLSPLLDRLEALLAAPSKSKEWTNDFARFMNFVRYALTGMGELYLEIPELKSDGHDVHSSPDVPPSFIAPLPPFKSGFVLADPQHPRYKSLMGVRSRIATCIHSAIAVLKDHGEEASIDAVRMTVRSTGTFLLKYGMESRTYDNEWKGYNYLEKQSKLYAKQRELPRSVWVRRADLYHSTRLRLNSQRRRRSEQDNALIMDLLDLSISVYPRIRRIAQSQLSSVSSIYDGVKSLVIDKLLAALSPGTDPDVAKGALYILGNKGMSGFVVKDWRYFGTYLLHLLRAQHQEKPSVQALVAGTLEGIMALIREPMTLAFGSSETSMLDASRAVESDLFPHMDQLSAADRSELRVGVAAAKNRLNDSYTTLIPELLALAQQTTTHWRYQVAAARLLRLLLRRDMPTSPDVAAYFINRITDPHPTLRTHAQNAMTRILYFVKLRSLCGSDEALFLQEATNPLNRLSHPATTSPTFTQDYLEAFRHSPAPKDVGKGFWMQDKAAVGWLCWGEEIKETRFADWDEEAFAWEAESEPALAVIRARISEPDFWKALSGHWAQEKSRNYLSADNIDVLRSLCQIYGELPLIELTGIMQDLLDQDDKDKQRALAEFLAGLLRGSKHWPGSSRSKLWDWITPRLPEMYARIKPDTYEAWKMFYEHVLYQRDPRRMSPMVDFILAKGRDADFTGGSAFDLRKSVQLLSSLMRCFAWRFAPWADEFITLYFANADSDYVEVRNLIAGNIVLLDNVQWHPSYPSATAFVSDCLDKPEKDVFDTKGHFHDRMAQFIADFPRWRAERPSGPAANSSTYDKTGSTVTRWLYAALSDVHAPAVFDYILPFLPEIFQMREMLDSDELHKMAAVLLIFVCSTTPPVHLVEPLIRGLLTVLKDSTSWRIRLHAIPILSVIYYRELPLINEELGATIMDTLSQCLHDENEDVRQTAASALSGVLRCSRRGSITVLKDRFLRELKAIKLPPRRDAAGNISQAYQLALIKVHAAILGVTALIEAFPYTVPSFLPDLLTDTLATHASDPTPISTTIRACAASFQRTHADSWHLDKEKFTEDQLDSLRIVISGTSYYA